MENYPVLQQELFFMSKSRFQHLDLPETGRRFNLTKPMYQVLTYSQHYYNLLARDMRKRMLMLKRQMIRLQIEMNDMLKLL